MRLCAASVEMTGLGCGEESDSGNGVLTGSNFWDRNLGCRFQLLTPTIFWMEAGSWTVLRKECATSAREMLKPKRGRRPVRTRYFAVNGLLVSCGGRTMVQSRPLSIR